LPAGASVPVLYSEGWKQWGVLGWGEVEASSSISNTKERSSLQKSGQSVRNADGTFVSTETKLTDHFVSQRRVASNGTTVREL
jgi:hypothetical protein